MNFSILLAGEEDQDFEKAKWDENEKVMEETPFFTVATLLNLFHISQYHFVKINIWSQLGAG